MTDSTLKEQFNREDMLKAIECIPTRAENQPEEVNTLENFVRIVDFDSLSVPDAQILYGRNGTGKTHLLRAYYQYCEAQFENTKLLPIYIDFKKLDLGLVLPSIRLEDLLVRF